MGGKRGNSLDFSLGKRGKRKRQMEKKKRLDGRYLVQSAKKKKPLEDMFWFRQALLKICRRWNPLAMFQVRYMNSGLCSKKGSESEDEGGGGGQLIEQYSAKRSVASQKKRRNWGIQIFLLRSRGRKNKGTGAKPVETNFDCEREVGSGSGGEGEQKGFAPEGGTMGNKKGKRLGSRGFEGGVVRSQGKKAVSLKNRKSLGNY